MYDNIKIEILKNILISLESDIFHEYMGFGFLTNLVICVNK